MKLFCRLGSFLSALMILVILFLFNHGDTFFVMFNGVLGGLFFMTLSIILMILSLDNPAKSSAVKDANDE